MTETRNPRGSVSRVTIGRAEEFGYPAANTAATVTRMWVVRCDAHIEDRFTGTKAHALKYKSQDFCVICMGTYDDLALKDEEDTVDEVSRSIPFLHLGLEPKPMTDSMDIDHIIRPDYANSLKSLAAMHIPSDSHLN